MYGGWAGVWDPLLCLDPLEETFREMTVLREGGVLFLERTPSGPRVVRYGCES